MLTGIGVLIILRKNDRKPRICGQSSSKLRTRPSVGPRARPSRRLGGRILTQAAGSLFLALPLVITSVRHVPVCTVARRPLYPEAGIQPAAAAGAFSFPTAV